MKKLIVLLICSFAALFAQTAKAQCTHTFDPNAGEQISLSTAATLTGNWRHSFSAGVNLAAGFGVNEIDALRGQSGIYGIRAYFAIDENGKITAVLVGINQCDEDMTNGILLERGICCTRADLCCPMQSTLNSD